MPLTERTEGDLAAYWANFFGCPPGLLAEARGAMLPHAELDNYNGLFSFWRGEAALISVPPAGLEGWRARLAGAGPAALRDAAALAGLAGAPMSQVIGPAVLAYADEATLRPLPTAGTRLLTAADEGAYERMRAACPPLDWEHGGSAFSLLPLAGRFVRDELVALAGYELWGERIAHIAIVTRPEQRGRGYGAEAVSLLAEAVVARGLIAQYRTLRANAPSMRIGQSLGFAHYAETLAVRL